MIKLSKRLEAIVNFCDRGKIIADIGTDHGFVPNFLYEQDRTRKIIAADISEKSLKKSLEFSKIRSNEKNIVHVISDGLKNIDGAENIIIAGMGGVLIADILEKDPLCIRLYKSTKGIQEGNCSFDDVHPLNAYFCGKDGR